MFKRKFKPSKKDAKWYDENANLYRERIIKGIPDVMQDDPEPWGRAAAVDIMKHLDSNWAIEGEP